MKKRMPAAAALALSLSLLAGCGLEGLLPGGGDEAFTLPGESAALSMAESAPESLPQSENPESQAGQAEIQINWELLGLLGKTNAELREYLPDNRAISLMTNRGSGSLAGKVLGLPRKLSFEMKGTDEENIAAADAYVAAGGIFSTGQVEGNVFSDNAKVVFITAANHGVQECLFVPGAELTRTSLNEFFGQEPVLEPGGEYPGVDYSVWECYYEYDGHTFEILYAEYEDEDDYLPIGAFVWQGTRADINDKLVELDMSRWPDAMGGWE